MSHPGRPLAVHRIQFYHLTTLLQHTLTLGSSSYAVVTAVQGWASPSVSVMRGPLHGRSDRSRPHRPAVPSARCDCACQEPGLVIWRQRVGRQRLRDHRQGGLHGVTNLASAWLPAWPAWRSPSCFWPHVLMLIHGSALSVSARRCCGEQGCAAAALACSA